MEVMTQLAAAAPQVVLAMLDVVFEIHPNLPRKPLVLERIRSVTGQAPADGKLSPEQQQAKQEQQAKAKAEFELQMASVQAEIKEKQAKGEKLDAETMATRLQALRDAAEAAQVLAAMPQATPVADELLRSAGFQDQAGAQVLPTAPAAQVPAQPAMPAETMPMQDQQGAAFPV